MLGFLFVFFNLTTQLLWSFSISDSVLEKYSFIYYSTDKSLFLKTDKC